MVTALLALASLVALPTAPAPRPVPVLPFTDVVARDGRLVATGPYFEAAARRMSVSPDGKLIVLIGTDDEPAVLRCRPADPQTRMEVSGKKITVRPADGIVRVEGGSGGAINPPAPK